MTYLIASLWLPILLSAVLGFAIGAWIWRDPSRDIYDEDVGYAPAAAPIIPPAPPPIDAEPPFVEETAPEAETDSETEHEAEPQLEPEPEYEPVPEPEPVQPPSPFLAAPNGDPDTLTLIKGVGPKLSDMLQALGVFHFTQIAEWDADQVAEVDSQLGAFSGRVSRDRWVDQARMLANRDIAAFEREFGKMNGRL